MKNTKLTNKLNKIREPRRARNRSHDILASIAIFAIGILLGIFAKYIDGMEFETFNWWQQIAARLDLGNLLTETGIWMVMALIIATLSRSSGKAAINVFLFFAGMCVSYHICSVIFKGFDPGNYMLIWYGITLVSPLLGIFCWYARSEAPAAIILDALIFMVLSVYCFSVGQFYFYLLGATHTLIFIAAVAALYKSPKQTAIAVPAGIVLSIVFSNFLHMIPI